MAILLLFLSLFLISSSEAFIGVTVDTDIINLPDLFHVGNAVNRSVLRHVKLFNMDTNVISVFAGFNLHMIVSTNRYQNTTQAIDSFWNYDLENDWVTALLPWSDKIDILDFANQFIGGCCNDYWRVPIFFDAFRRLQYAFASENVRNVKIATTINVTELIQHVGPPSKAYVKPKYYLRLKTLLDILRDNNSPLLVNIYPFYEYRKHPTKELLLFSLFQNNTSRFDPGTGLTYHNMFDWLYDGVRNAIDGLEYEDVEIIVSETGWPSWSDRSRDGASKENAKSYNKHLVQHLSSNRGTPLRPNTYIKAYIHTLLDQNQKYTDPKLGFGLLNHDLTWKYKVV